MSVLEDREMDMKETGKGIYSAMLMTIVPLATLSALLN